jgi:Phage integrase family
MRPKDRATLGLAVYAGLRLGELLALNVAAIDLDGGWIHVHRSWDRGTKQFIPTKSRKPRSVPIIDKLAVLLADHFVLLDHPTDGLLFPSSNNPEWPTDPGILRRRIHARWKKAGLKPLGFHEARHTYASIGIAAGLNPQDPEHVLGPRDDHDHARPLWAPDAWKRDRSASDAGRLSRRFGKLEPSEYSSGHGSPITSGTLAVPRLRRSARRCRPCRIPCAGRWNRTALRSMTGAFRSTCMRRALFYSDTRE